jgi:hypothetical protein
MTHDEAERRRNVIAQARATLKRLNTAPAFEPRDPLTRDPIEEWRRNMPQKAEPEPPQRERKLDTAPVDWDARIAAAIGREHEFLIEIIGTALHEALAAEREALCDEIRTRDERIGKLEVQLARLEVEIARAQVKIAQAGVDRGRQALGEAPLPRPARGLN